MVDNAQRIITHMNKDHKLALEDYLYVYGGVPITEKIKHVRLHGIELECMTLQFMHEDIDCDVEKTILFKPPLKDWSEAKSRLVTMAHEAADKRNLSHIQINDMSYPDTAIEYIVIIGVFLPFICYKWRKVLSWLPLPSLVIEFLDNDNVLRGIMALAIVTHVLETWTLLRPRLNYYRVPTDFLVEWYLFGLLEGFAPVKRLERMAREKLREKR
ncbi:hypothetical protein HG536_0A06330 [Torulaspora globosa]|uniref:DUF2470 domain-containing protein n=1 Tax=Torulaspora globosa TaxID=48254 RepID=A0A7G3ZBD2_9SACH|nr:uncharacterized protein HG536_0A06330 [Torulaspora globosa]QLL30818.1 hypothetical protein HG536_0A06330 [Torulaspora globosa]